MPILLLQNNKDVQSALSDDKAGLLGGVTVGRRHLSSPYDPGMAELQVFISHAGTDSSQAAAVAQALEGAGLGVSLDRRALEPGDTFIAFMEEALTESDYCLLLWSRAAAEREWVKVEWQAALYRTVKEARRFLLVGRLEDHALPKLLAPRLFVDLFPAVTPGIDRVIAMCRQDLDTAAATARPVGQPARAQLTEDAGGDTIYITSKLFQITVPVRVLLDAPVGVCLDRFVTDLRLPRKLDHQGLVGTRYDYNLLRGEERLARDVPFSAQGVGQATVLTLETEVTPFAAAAPVAGSVSSVRYRSSDEQAYAEAERAVMAAVARAGLGS